MVAWGVTHVFGMVGHSNLGFADAMRAAEERGDLTFIGIRHEGAAAFAGVGLRQAHRPARPRASRSRARARPTCSPASTTPRSTGRRCSPSRARCRRRCADGARSRTSTSPPRSPTSPARRRRCTRLRPRRADEPRRASTRCSSAASRTSSCPTRCRCCPPATCEAGSPERPAGRARASRRRPPPVRRSRSTCSPARSAGRSSSGTGHAFGMADVRRARRTRSTRRSLTTFKAKGHVSDDHPLACGVLGRSGTPGGVVAHERVRPARRVRRVVREPHRHRRLQADHPGRLRPEALGRFHPVTVPVLGDIGVTARLLARSAADPCRPASTSGPTSPSAWAIWRAEKARRRDDDRGLGLNSAVAVRRAVAPRPRRRGDRGRRRQQHLLVRPLLRVQPARPC